METRPKGTICGLPALAILSSFVLAAAYPALLPAQAPVQSSASSPQPVPANPGPPTNPGFFPLSQVRPGMTGTAWTVFQGSTPEPMQVEILGVLRGARGPGQDLILARLHGAKPEYTGVVEGMSGSPVYIDGKLAGSLSYRIGQFTKEPIAGITPIEQMLEVRDIPVRDLSPDLPSPRRRSLLLLQIHRPTRATTQRSGPALPRRHELSARHDLPTYRHPARHERIPP